MANIKTGRWDIDHIINDEKDLVGLVLLYAGRANDLDEIVSRGKYTLPEHEKRFMTGKAEAYRQVATELKQALKIVDWQTHYKKASDLSKGFLDEE